MDFQYQKWGFFWLTTDFLIKVIFKRRTLCPYVLTIHVCPCVSVCAEEKLSTGTKQFHTLSSVWRKHKSEDVSFTTRYLSCPSEFVVRTFYYYSVNPILLPGPYRGLFHVSLRLCIFRGSVFVLTPGVVGKLNRSNEDHSWSGPPDPRLPFQV